VIPNGSLGGAPTVNSTVIVNVDANGNARVTSEPGAGDLGKVVADAANAAAVRAIQNDD
jgi:hypothetical protein